MKCTRNVKKFDKNIIQSKMKRKNIITFFCFVQIGIDRVKRNYESVFAVTNG